VNINKQCIKIENIFFDFDKSLARKVKTADEQALLNGVNFSLHRGQVVVIKGANGVGKTTLGKCIMGIHRIDSGHIRVDGQNMTHKRLDEIGSKVGYLFQNPSRQIFSKTVEEEMVFTAKYSVYKEPSQRKERIQMLLDTFNLKQLKDQYCHKLSLGEKQRLALATAVFSNQDYVILDEPTSSLDESSKVSLVNRILEMKTKGKGILIISHDMQFIEQVASRIFTLEKGVLYEG